MSLREEDRQKSGCPSRGLGLAAAAIGVGVGAALYYFFSKGPENPSSEGASSGSWHCESPQTLDGDADISDDSYSTISENTTTDTSFHDSSHSLLDCSHSSYPMSIDDDEDLTMDDDLDNSTSSTHSQFSMPSPNSWDSEFRFGNGVDHWDRDYSNELQFLRHSPESLLNLIRNRLVMSSDAWESDISMELPSYRRPLYRELMPRFVERFVRSRERRWSLEECSICFEVILRDQEVMTLPCTHHFHQACILPWLQQQQTCPNCRKNID